MIKIITALYKNGDSADEAVETLLDQGFSHKDITLMSGHYWKDGADPIEINGSEVIVQVQTLVVDEARIAEGTIYKFCPEAVQEQIEFAQDDWMSIEWVVALDFNVLQY